MGSSSSKKQLLRSESALTQRANSSLSARNESIENDELTVDEQRFAENHRQTSFVKEASQADLAGSALSIRDKIMRTRSTLSAQSTRENVQPKLSGSNASIRDATLTPPLDIQVAKENSFFSHNVPSHYSLQTERTSTAMSMNLEDKKPVVNIFDDGTEKLEGCEKVLESIY